MQQSGAWRKPVEATPSRLMRRLGSIAQRFTTPTHG
jgi:hypothetical protein